MQEPVGSPAPQGAVLQPRRRRSRSAIVVAVVVVVLSGRRLGWFGGGGAAAPAPVPIGTSPAVTPAPVADAPSSTAPNAVTAASGADGPPAAAPSAPAPAAPAPAAEVPPGTGTVDGDRFASLLSLVSARREQGELGGALAALRRAEALPLDAGQRATVQRSTGELRADLDAAARLVAAQLTEGQVLAAHDRCRVLLTDGADLVAPVLARQLAFTDAAVDRLPARGALPWPIPQPLARDRIVRARLAAGEVTGRVVDGRSDQVTLRVEAGNGVTFPTLPVTACEPVGPTADEACEQALAALQGGDALLARLWLACARLRGGSAASARAGRLREILP